MPLIVCRANLTEDKHYDFRVRQGKVEAALVWLKAHNKCYRDVTISQERLSQLPMDNNLEHIFIRETTQLELPDVPDIQVGTAQVKADSTTEESNISDPDMGTSISFSNINK